MCGIAGFTGRSEPGVIDRMTDTLTHRGPDDRGVFIDEAVSLGHRRLSIIDLDASRQPMYSPDGNVVLVYNGEIYNFRELRKDLAAQGWKFATAGDTETVLAAYSIYGHQEFVNHLSGMFALAIYDRAAGRLLLARDRVGIKPLYYALKNGELVFASEVKAILARDGAAPELDPSVLWRQFTFRYSPGAETLFKGVSKLPPGALLIWRDGNVEIKKYWEPAIGASRHEGLDELAHEFDELFSRAVRGHMIADVPVGAFLSGGLDSSYLVAVMASLADKKVATFSVGFSDSDRSELEYARIVAEKFDTAHNTILCDVAEEDVFRKVAWHLDEPLADATCLPTYLMSRLTVRHVKVVLSGEGSDEFLGGYGKYRAIGAGEGVAPFVPRVFSQALSGALARFSHIGRLSLFMAGKNPTERYLNLTGVFSRREIGELFTPEFRKKVFAGRDPHDDLAPLLNSKRPIFDRLLELDVKTWLPDDLLLKNDKMTMAHSLEARVPFLDRDLMEFMRGLPAAIKLCCTKDKIILRRAMQARLPAQIVNRPKTGFTVPLDLLLKNGLMRICDGLMDREKIAAMGVFDPAAIEKIRSRPLDDAYRRRQFYTVFSFLLWLDVFKVRL